MNAAPPTREPAPPSVAPSGNLRWWGGFTAGVDGRGRRFVVRWPRVLAGLGVAAVAAWLAGATALWGFYRFKREIPSVAWADVAAARFDRVQAAVGAHYFASAKQAWEAREYARAVMLARAAVRKAPADLETRLFLSGVWRQLRRGDDALRVLREGLPWHAADARLQRAFVETALAGGHFAELLRWLREELPARGARPLVDGGAEFRLAEVRAEYETAGAAEAHRLAAQSPGLADEPLAAPLLARIEFDLGRGAEALRRVLAARDASPERPELHEAVVDLAQRLARPDVAREAAARFFAKFPDVASAHLRFLETHEPGPGEDEAAWMTAALRYLVRYRAHPAALERLGDLAARRGWSDLAFLLYQHSLQETLGSRTFALHWVGSLVKRGEFVAAERVLAQVATERDAATVAAAPAVTYFSAMVEWGLGRESEAQRHVDRLRHRFAGDDRQLRAVAQVFRTLGFPPLAERLLAPAAPVSAASAG